MDILLRVAVRVIAGIVAVQTVDTVHAASLRVDSNADAVDAVPGDGVCASMLVPPACTLRAAIMEANALPGFDTLEVPAGLYGLRLPGAGEDDSARGDLDIREPMVMRISGWSGIGSRWHIDISGGHPAFDDRLLDVDAADAVQSTVLSDLRLAFGNPDNAEIEGGAVRVRSGSVLELRRVVSYASGESPRGGDFAVYGELHAYGLHSSDILIGARPTPGHGGSLYVGPGGVARIEDCRFDSRIARGLGGAIYAEGPKTQLRIRRCHLNNRSDLFVHGIALVGDVLAELDNVEIYHDIRNGYVHDLLRLEQGAQLTLRHATLLNGRIVVADTHSLLRIGNSTTGDIPIGTQPDDGVGTGDCTAPAGRALSDGGVLSQPGNPCFAEPNAGDVTASDFRLSTSGGLYHQPAIGSPALDAAIDEPCLPDDALGQHRPQTPMAGQPARCDIGAIEIPGAVIFASGFDP